MLNDETCLEKELPAEDIPAADFLISEIAGHQRAIEGAKTAAKSILEARQKEIARWLEEAIAPEQAAIDRLEPILRSIIMRKTEGTGKKSIKLPSGRAGFRSIEPTFFFYGEKADANNGLFVTTLARNGTSAFIKQKPVLDWASMKKTLRVADDGSVCTSDGDIIEGLTAQNNPDRFYVTSSTTNE